MPKYPSFEKARCAGLDTEFFFPTSYREWDDTKDALQAICNSCPIQQKCLDYALRVKVSGVWGGTWESERHALRKKLNIVAEPMSIEV